MVSQLIFLPVSHFTQARAKKKPQPTTYQKTQLQAIVIAKFFVKYFWSKRNHLCQDSWNWRFIADPHEVLKLFWLYPLRLILRMYIQLLIPIKYCRAASAFWFSFFLRAWFSKLCECLCKRWRHRPAAQRLSQRSRNHHSIFRSLIAFFKNSSKRHLGVEGRCCCPWRVLYPAHVLVHLWSRYPPR